MEKTDYSEITLLMKSAEKALFSGTLNDWQHANTSLFHVMASFIVDLNDRLARLELSSDQFMAHAGTPVSQIILD